MATRLDAITTAYQLVTGKSTLPPTGTAKRALLDSLANKFYRDWQTEPGVEWQSLLRQVSAGTATAGQDTYELASAVHFLSKDEHNQVRIKDTYYKVVTAAQLPKYKDHNAVALYTAAGTQSLQFSQPIAEGSALIGETIKVPAIIKLADLTDDSSEVLIDQPEWLGERIAAQYAFSFRSTREMYDDLLALANDRMESMKQANETGSDSTSTGIDYFALTGNVWS